MKNIKQPKYNYKQVMLLDDSELDNFINEKMIEASHFSERIYVSTHGQSALEFLNNLSVAGEASCSIYPQLIFVDLNMPVIDGFQFIKNLKANPKNCPEPKLVILTSSVSDDDRLRALEISPDIVFLHKPLTEDMLKQL
jgi:CheY-like chemotaxis protein